MKRLFLTLALLISLSQGKMGLGECRYILHGLENEFWLIMGYAYFINGYAKDGAEAFSKIWTYPEENAKVDDYLRALRKKGDTFTNADSENKWLLQRARVKKAEIDNQLKICQKIKKALDN